MVALSKIKAAGLNDVSRNGDGIDTHKIGYLKGKWKLAL